MADWQLQSDFASENARTRQTVAYLEQLIGVNRLEAAMDAYFAGEPNGSKSPWPA